MRMFFPVFMLAVFLCVNIVRVNDDKAIPEMNDNLFKLDQTA